MNWGKHFLLSIILLLLLSFSLLSFLGSSPSSSRGAIHKDNQLSEGWITTTIPRGGSIFSVLSRQALPPREVAILAYRFGEYIDVTTLQPGDTLKIKLTPDKQHIDKLMFIQEKTTRHHFQVQGDSLAYTLEELPVTYRKRILEGSMQRTLDATLIRMGLSQRDKQLINNGLEGEINFARDARNGDKFTIFLEERSFEGEVLPGRTIYYVQYSGERTGTHELFRFEDKDRESVLNGLYNREGKCNSSSGVGFPLSAIHVVSSFGKRLDPFHGGWAMHQGIDYRAGYGTPVFAVANGKVTGCGYHGGWGNEIVISHPSGLSTQYAHLSSLSVHQGQAVRKGQIIGRVGSTGRSTGAHLHFGLLKGKSYINPTNLKMVGAEKLSAAQMQEFKRQQEAIRSQMMAARNPQAALPS